ncbi:TraR/DksA C4-type zinc finger protein [Streptomyces sp. Y7]|uniref:TraR/DksA C4-type zinc finger protein n=1 Tax=Streptomyces sp. Y7 TaxID=3342392 RepID=UPI0037143D70
MVAKKTAVQQSASSRSTHARAGAAGGAAKDVKGKKTAQGGAAEDKGKAREGAGQEAGGRSGKAAGKKTAAVPEAAEKKAAAAPRAAGKKAAGKKEAAAAKPAAGKSADKGEAKEAGARKSAAKKSDAKKSDAKKSTAKKSTARKSAAGKRAVADSRVKKVGAAQAAEQTGATTVVAKKTPGTATAAKTAVPKARLAAVEPGELAVRPGEDPWTAEEVEEARAELMAEVMRLRNELESSEQSLVGLMRDSGDGAGDDQADTGAKNITREHELALAANAREMLEQTERALERLDAGTYGLCENCGKPIGKARMQAFPRATLCVECKQKQERRY